MIFRKQKADRIKIAHVTGVLHFGGKENGIVNLVNALDPDVFENHIFTFVKDGPLTARIDPNRCRVVELGDKLGGDYRLYFKLAQQFRRHRIHIAHTHSWATLLEGVIGAKMALVPIVIHGEHGTIKADTNAHIYVQRVVWRIADRVLSVSEELRERLCRSIGFPKERIDVIANGVDLIGSRPLQSDIDLRATLGLPPKAFVFGAVGRLVPVKGYPVLLKACRQVFRDIPEAYLLIAGAGPLRHELDQMAKDYRIAERVKFLGWQPDVQAVLRALDLFVLASHSEGMSNTILEAMASGLPVVATNVGGNPELVIPGDTGLLVPHGDPSALAEALIGLMRDPASRSRMGRRSRQRALENFSMETMARNYSSLYLKMFLRNFSPTGRLQRKLQAIWPNAEDCSRPSIP